MSRTLPHKTILIFGVVFCFAVLIVVSGCSSNQKKRGIVFRGDWAFEVNRTPWVGHPGNTDIPGEEDGENSANRQGKSLCSKDKKSSLGDSLLGPLTSLKSKCRCKDCVAASGGNFTTGYHPALANTFPNPIPGAYPGTIPQGSLSLPPGAIVVPMGVLMPNGSLLPHHLFYPQPFTANMTGNPGINPITGQSIQPVPNLQGQQLTIQQGQVQPQILPQTLPQTLPQPEQGTPTQMPTPQGIPVQPPQMPSPQLQTPTLAPPLEGTVVSQGMMPAYQIVTPGTQTAVAQNAVAQNAMMPNAMTQHALMQNLNAANPMMINPAHSQVVPGLSMTGTQAPGYPPIGYAPSGYSMGYAQQVSAPPLAGPLGPMPSQQQSLAATGGSQAKPSGTQAAEVDDEEPAAPRHVAAMPYPRHHPVPTRPVYQRNMGMAPDYAAVRPPMVSPLTQNPTFQGMTQAFQGMMPQRQISQAAAQQEQQMMLDRQRQALIMQQNAAIAQTASRQASRTAPPQRPPVIAENDVDDENVAPVPPTSKILLANHQTNILQPPPPRVSQVAHTTVAPTAKKQR